MSKSRPFPQSYWVETDLFCAGHYPGDKDPVTRHAKLVGLANAGIRRVINLIPEYETGRDDIPFDPYAPLLQAFVADRGYSAECLRFGYPDGGIPEISFMKTILDNIDASIAARDPIYVHCWGGHGRTSTVVGCYLVRHGLTPAQAIERILDWRANLPRNWFPYQNEQQAFVEKWREGQ
jgi:Cyclin-dependent kinase inhibitor 3 (CDKN3)